MTRELLVHRSHFDGYKYCVNIEIIDDGELLKVKEALGKLGFSFRETHRGD